MKRTDADYHVGNLFQSGNPLTGQRGTRLDHTWLNSVQEELVAPILAAGIVLDEGDTGQLLKAIQRLGLGYDTLAIAQAAAANAINPITVDTVIATRGHAAPGDGGGGLYRVVVVGTPGTHPDADRLLPIAAPVVTALSYGATGNGVNDDAPALQALIGETETNGQGYIYFPGWDREYLINSPLQFHLGDIRIFGDKGVQFRHPFVDGTDRLMRRGDLVAGASCSAILSLGGYKTHTTDPSPYASNPARNYAMSYTVDHLSLRGTTPDFSNGIELTGMQNGPDRPIYIEKVSGYRLKNGIYAPPAHANMSIQVADLHVDGCGFGFCDKAVFSEGPIFGSTFTRNNFEANASGCIHGQFEGSIAITDNMMENTPNPVNLEPKSNLALRARGNYFEFHPTSDYLYRVKGFDSYLHYGVDIDSDIYSGGIPDYPVVMENAGRWRVKTDQKTLIKNVGAGETFVIKRGSTFIGHQGTLDFQNMAGTIVAHVDAGRSDSIGSAFHAYPHDPATYYPAETPLGTMDVVNLEDGLRINFQESIQNKLVQMTFLMRCKPGMDVGFPPRQLSARTTAGGYVAPPGSFLDYIANDISQGDWVNVMILWRTTSSVQTVEFFTASYSGSEIQVAGAAYKVGAVYTPTADEAITEINPVVLRQSPRHKAFTFTGNGSTTAFALTKGWNPTAVFVDGSRQREGTDYTVSSAGNVATVTFTAAPGAVDIIIDGNRR